MGKNIHIIHILLHLELLLSERVLHTKKGHKAIVKTAVATVTALIRVIRSAVLYSIGNIIQNYTRNCD